jgi:hypothetical protein
MTRGARRHGPISTDSAGATDLELPPRPAPGSSAVRLLRVTHEQSAVGRRRWQRPGRVTPVRPDSSGLPQYTCAGVRLKRHHTRFGTSPTFRNTAVCSPPTASRHGPKKPARRVCTPISSVPPPLRSPIPPHEQQRSCPAAPKVVNAPPATPAPPASERGPSPRAKSSPIGRRVSYPSIAPCQSLAFQRPPRVSVSSTRWKGSVYLQPPPGR